MADPDYQNLPNQPDPGYEEFGFDPVEANKLPADLPTSTNLDTTDLTDFIKDSQVLFISDFEGTAPTKHFEKFKEFCTTEGKKVIFMGDLFDSTVVLGDKECHGDECKNPETKHKCLTKDNYCALQTIKLMVDNPDRCKYVVGNRDLNKAKLFPFFQFKDGSPWWKVDPATGRDWTSYAAIVSFLLKETTTNSDVWLISSAADMALFKPFWNLEVWNDVTTDIKDKDGNVTGKTNNPGKRVGKNYNDLFERFERMFGKDGVEGTMGASITLKSIPNELLQEETIFKYLSELSEPITLSSNDPLALSADDLKKVKQVRAALIITLFMRMLDKDLWLGDARKRSNEKADLKNLGSLDGYLYYYLMQAKPAYYADYERPNAPQGQQHNLFMFAHAGITSEFVETKGLGAFTPFRNVNWTQLIADPPPKVGGVGPITGQDIKTSIENFNKGYFGLLKEFFLSKFDINEPLDDTEFLGPDIQSINAADAAGKRPFGKFKTPKSKYKQNWKRIMLTLLQLTAGTQTKISKFLTKPADGTFPPYKAAYSPIQIKRMVGKDTDEPAFKILDVTDYDRVFNVFGHASASSGYSFGMVPGSTKTYYINTDYSSTLFKESLLCDPTYNDTNLILVLDTKNDILFVDGIVSLKPEYKPYATPIDKSQILAKLPATYNYYVHGLVDVASITPKDGKGFIFKLDPTFNIFEATDFYEQTPGGEATLVKKQEKQKDGTEKTVLTENKFNGVALINGKQYFIYSSPFSKAGYFIAFIPLKDEENAPGVESAPVGGRRRRSTRKQKAAVTKRRHRRRIMGGRRRITKKAKRSRKLSRK